MTIHHTIHDTLPHVPRWLQVVMDWSDRMAGAENSVLSDRPGWRWRMRKRRLGLPGWYATTPVAQRLEALGQTPSAISVSSIYGRLGPVESGDAVVISGSGTSNGRYLVVSSFTEADEKLARLGEAVAAATTMVKAFGATFEQAAKNLRGDRR